MRCMKCVAAHVLIGLHLHRVHHCHAETNRRLSSLHSDFDELIFGREENDTTQSWIDNPSKPILVSRLRPRLIGNVVCYLLCIDRLPVWTSPRQSASVMST